MTEGIDTIIHQNSSTFIAVGAAHLLGEQGIVPLLRAKGYTVNVVASEFTSQSSHKQGLLSECTHYEYLDERHGATLNFTGKPAIQDYESTGSRFVQYIELGQGNTYSMGMYHYNYKSNLDSIIQSYFNNKDYKLTGFDSIKIDHNTMAYQGRIEYNGISEWLRVFHRNNILYELTAFGGHRFMNSNRAQTYFNSFKFKDFESYGDDQLTENVSSNSQTMNLAFPKGYYEKLKQEDYDEVWSALWFNPSSEETFFALESIMTDNTIYYSNETYGNYLLKDYPLDSITFTDEKHEKGAYLQKSFTIRGQGTEIHGKIRVLGNMIQLVQYTGDNQERKDEFLSHFEGVPVFPKIEKETKLSNKTFSTTLTKTGFRKQEVKSNYKYRNTHEYLLNDTKHSISYHVLIKDYKTWAFSQKPTDDLLRAQISWPDEELNAIVDTVYDLTGKYPTLYFDVYYPTSENRFVGKTSIIGKSIIVASATYPNLAHDQYQNISFLDSLTFFISDSISIHEVNLPLLKNELMVNGEEAIEQLVVRNHFNESTLNTMLEWTPTFWNNFDPRGSLQGSVLVELKNKGAEIDVLAYWKEHVNSKNYFLTLATLHLLQEEKQASDFIYVVEESYKKEIIEIDYYRYIEINKDEISFLKSVWPVFSPLLEDSMAWSTSFIIPELLKDEFFYSYFTSDAFIHAVTSKIQPPWAAFRYLEIMHEYGVPKELFLKMIKEWSKSKNDHKIGSIAAWKTILNEKVSLKEKRLVKKDAAVAISYSKVMAVSESPVFNLLSFEDMIGYLSFDHYKDAYIDKNKSINHIENRLMTIKGQNRNFAIYKAVENGRTYFMARELFKNNILPSYGGFGSDTYFMYKEKVYDAKTISNELIKKIIEKEKDN